MFTKKEIKATKKVCDRKLTDLLKSKEGSDADYIRNLQTLIQVKDAAEKMQVGE